MPLPAPNLDDRRFQELVDDAKRLVQQRCPEWTDHNVSDPGVTLIETFAYMVDQLLYRMNRVPDRHYVKFLELIGVKLFPPAAARADVTFWLSAPQTDVVPVPAGVQAATARADGDSVVFATYEPLNIVPCSLARLASSINENQFRDHTDVFANHQHFACFDDPPKPDDAMYVGLSAAVPSCAVLLRFECTIEGVGVDPRHPPLVWEAFTGDGWERCDLDRDGTGGLNRDGDVVVHVPRGHLESTIGKRKAGWLRCRVVEAEEGQPKYSSSPRIHGLTVCTIGGSSAAVHAEVIQGEILGLSEGVPGQRFRLKRGPVVPSDAPLTIEVAAGDGWDEWISVETFAASSPSDKHFVLDASAGEVVFGPALRQPDGSLLHRGAVPPKAAPIRMVSYWVGGGRRGNVASRTITVLRTPIPFITRVDNRRAATGGVDGEELESAKERGPILLRTRNRAITAEDYEHLGKEAAPEVARIRCAPATEAVDAGGLRVLVVPHAADDEIGRLRFEQLVPSDDTLSNIATYLDERRVIGARVSVEPPVYQGIMVVARIRGRARANPERLQAQAVEALFRYFNPLTGGPDGQGWPFGRPIHVGEVYSVLQRLRGTEYIEDARLFPVNPITGDRGEAVQRLDLDAHALVFSYEHQVLVEQG